MPEAKTRWSKNTFDIRQGREARPCTSSVGNSFLAPCHKHVGAAFQKGIQLSGEVDCVETVQPGILEAVRKRVAMDRIAQEFRPALDKVWAFLNKNPGLRTDGHNVFLYHHETPTIMPIDFGVEVTRSFAGASPGSGEVACACWRGGISLLQYIHKKSQSAWPGLTMGQMLAERKSTAKWLR